MPYHLIRQSELIKHSIGNQSPHLLVSMKHYNLKLHYICYSLLCSCLLQLCQAVNMQQFMASLDMMRNGCAPKFPSVTLDVMDKLRVGDFPAEPTKDLMCYAKCVAQLAGTISKKGEFSVSKALAQMPIILPLELQEPAKSAVNHCKDAQKPYKDSCEKLYYTTKCMADFDREHFIFP